MNFNQVKSEGKRETKSILKTVFQYSNILGLLGIIVAILLFYLAEKKKELTLSVDSFISLVDKTTLNGSGIKVSFDGVTQVRTVLCHFMDENSTYIGNIGNFYSRIYQKTKRCSKTGNSKNYSNSGKIF